MTQRFIPGITAPANLQTKALWFAFVRNKLLCSQNSGQPIPRLADFAQLGLETVRQQYLGTLGNRHCFSVELAQNALPPGMTFKSLRAAYAQLGEELFVVAGRAVQIVDWDRNHQHCGRCGAKTVDQEIDRAKECPQCGLVSYPRLSPAIIVRVQTGRQLLLARAPGWPEGMHSVLAGFVEPGETLEQAVAREVLEEVGIRVKNISYFGSQPWPFPNSLMIAFTADYAGGDMQIDPAEIESAGWYSVDNLPMIPSKMSIARRLIDNFIDSFLEVAADDL